MNLSGNKNWFRLGAQLLIILGIVLVSCNRYPPEKILLITGLGSIVLEVYPEKAPVTALNFLSLVEEGAYTNAFFYRVVSMDNQPGNSVKIEVIQGGLFEDDLVNKHESIAHETTNLTGIRHLDGVISMARNEPGSASTEFFICIGDQPSLDYGGDRNQDGQGFAAFGKVIHGMEVVRQIQSLPDTGQYLADRVLIREIKLIK